VTKKKRVDESRAKQRLDAGRKAGGERIWDSNASKVMTKRVDRRSPTLKVAGVGRSGRKGGCRTL